MRAKFCRMRGKRRRDVKILQLKIWESLQSHPSDLECVGQTAAGVAGVTHSVQGLAGEL